MYTNEKIYNTLKKAITVEGLGEELPNGEFIGVGLLREVMDMLKSNLQEEIAKKGGGKVKHLKIIQQVLKVNEKSSGKEKYMNAIPYKDGYFFTNTYEALISSQDFGYPHAEEDMSKLCGVVQSMETDEYPFSIKIDIDDVKLFISTHKKEKQTTPYTVNYGDGQKIGINPKYLLRCLQWAETDTIHIKTGFKPILIKGKENKAVVVPMKLKHKN